MNNIDSTMYAVTLPRVLVTEDDATMREMLVEALSDAGFSVDSAKNGKEALERMRKEKFDLLLIDVVMPVKGGFETLQAMKKDTALKDIPVIVLSNVTHEKDRQKAQELGALEYFVKAHLALEQLITYIRDKALKR